ncbi:GH1 family beta-glucosidase [Deinococcus oregonensis]|uniref:Beta-glucosidase n=1 Tax=Deinococcus oregonensis TaxID=1805970 RepID=A0ABV6B0C2_9DEIO
MSDLPAGFVWGAATAAYQIEGGVQEGGRGASVWDTFSHTAGRIKTGETGDVACDHYHRYREDVALMKDLGLTAYRFSVAWPRVQPEGRGRTNAAGLAFYDALTDELLEAGIQPWPTLFHWDLPQALEDEGGWLNRDTAHRFEDYAFAVGEKLADRAAGFMTLNEPFVVMALGYMLGIHAPGHQLGLAGGFAAAHHQLLAHGMAVRALREAGAQRVGIANNYAPAWPATDRDADHQAAAQLDALHNHLFTDPILRGEYPAAVLDLVGVHAPQALDLILPGDLATIAAPLDFLGVNYYQPDHVTADLQSPFGAKVEGVPGRERTNFGWSVVPEALTQTLTDLKARYGDDCPPIYVTESGCSQPDVLEGGRVRDDARTRYHEAHLDAVSAAIEQGADVRGYFAWSLMDNFEWAEGYSQRFGLVYVDFQTQERTPKDSFHWLKRRIGG